VLSALANPDPAVICGKASSDCRIGRQHRRKLGQSIVPSMHWCHWAKNSCDHDPPPAALAIWIVTIGIVTIGIVTIGIVSIHIADRKTVLIDPGPLLVAGGLQRCRHRLCHRSRQVCSQALAGHRRFPSRPAAEHPSIGHQHGFRWLSP